MIVAHNDHSSRLFCRCKDSLDTLRGKRERSLAENVNLGAECTQNVRLVEVIGRRNHNRIDPILLEQLFHVRVDIGHTEPLRQRAGLYTVVVADGDQRRSLDLREERKMRQLGDRSGAHERNPAVGRGCPISYVDRIISTRSPGAARCQSMRPTVVPG